MCLTAKNVKHFKCHNKNKSNKAMIGLFCHFLVQIVHFQLKRKKKTCFHLPLDNTEMQSNSFSYMSFILM